MDEWPEAFTVRGHATLPPGQEFRMALASDTDIWEATESAHDPATGEFEVRFSATEPRWGREGLAHSTRGRSLRLLRHAGTTHDSQWVTVAPGAGAAVISDFLHWHPGTSCDVRFTLTARLGALWVNVRPRWAGPR